VLFVGLNYMRFPDSQRYRFLSAGKICAFIQTKALMLGQPAKPSGCMEDVWGGQTAAI
jgi:hypothetical protein